MGAYALSWFLGAFLAVLAARAFGARPVAVVGALLLVAGRAVLQFTDGDAPQLYVASVAVLGGLVWLVATAIAPTRDLFPGLIWGFAVATGLHAALDTVDLVWRHGWLPVVLLALELVAFLAVLPSVVPYDHLSASAHTEHEDVHAAHCHGTPGTCADAPIPSGPGQMLMGEPLTAVPAMLSLLVLVAVVPLVGLTRRPELRPPPAFASA